MPVMIVGEDGVPSNTRGETGHSATEGQDGPIVPRSTRIIDEDGNRTGRYRVPDSSDNGRGKKSSTRRLARLLERQLQRTETRRAGCLARATWLTLASAEISPRAETCCASACGWSSASQRGLQAREAGQTAGGRPNVEGQRTPAGIEGGSLPGLWESRPGQSSTIRRLKCVRQRECERGLHGGSGTREAVGSGVEGLVRLPIKLCRQHTDGEAGSVRPS